MMSSPFMKQSFWKSFVEAFPPKVHQILWESRFGWIFNILYHPRNPGFRACQLDLWVFVLRIFLKFACIRPQGGPTRYMKWSKVGRKTWQMPKNDLRIHPWKSIFALETEIFFQIGMIWGYPTLKFLCCGSTALKRSCMTLLFRALKYRQLLLQQGKADYVCKHPTILSYGATIRRLFFREKCVNNSGMACVHTNAVIGLSLIWFSLWERAPRGGAPHHLWCSHATGATDPLVSSTLQATRRTRSGHHADYQRCDYPCRRESRVYYRQSTV